MNLSGKNIVVTGASSGIGAAIAGKISENGGKVILIARDKNRLESVYTSLTNEGHLFYTLDVTKFNEIEPIIADAVSKIGNISGFVHSAGVEITLPFRNMKPENFQYLFNTNVISGFEFARIISKAKYLKSEISSSFIFLGSIMSLVGQEGKIGYCTSKSALLTGVKAMALELATKNIRCNCVLPGVVQTPMVQKMFNELPELSVTSIKSKHPLGLGMPVDIANLVLFLLSDLSTWITGTEIVIDGGYTAQ
ncbi:MAG: SDR family oxidoreductase [Bacteroidota bacterium]